MSIRVPCAGFLAPRELPFSSLVSLCLVLLLRLSGRTHEFSFPGPLLPFFQVDCLYLDSFIDLGCHCRHQALGQVCLDIVLDPDRFPLEGA